MRILFLASPDPDYVADGLFHGLRHLLGADVVDAPRRDPLYKGTNRGELYGRGFGLYGLLDDVETDRESVWDREWDLVVSAVIWRDWDCWVRAWQTFGPRVRHAVVDGADLPFAYPYGPAWLRARNWPVPRADSRATYFKREWRRWSVPRWVHPVPLAISYPAEKVVPFVPPKTQEFGTHVIDLEVGERLGRRLAHERQHVFESEDQYLNDLRASRFGITTKRAGWDALRHYEIAAAGTVPCFRDLNGKPSTAAPHGLVPGRNCLSYADADDLLRQVAALSDDRYAQLAQGALGWARENTTVKRARWFLERALA